MLVRRQTILGFINTLVDGTFALTLLQENLLRDPMLQSLNLLLLILFPISWFAPLMRAGVLPIFGLSEISVVSGLIELFQSDILLAFIVTLFALIAPMAKTIGIALIHFGRMSPDRKAIFEVMGKLAMADVFLIALYVVIVKGVGLATVETAWGLYLFTGCILASLAISHLTRRP